MTEAEIRTDFEQYGGDVQDIFIVKDKSTGEQKGNNRRFSSTSIVFQLIAIKTLRFATIRCRVRQVL